MIEHARPTRAEVTDVAGACLAGADAVMLSAETATGKYPLETFKTMDSILREAEAYQFFSLGGKFKKTVNEKKNDLPNALGIATAQLSADLMVRSIFVITRSGYTARMVSSNRPAAPIIALTQSQSVVRKLNLLWGLYPHLGHKEFRLNEYLQYGENLIKKMKLAKKGDFIIMLSGLVDKNITTNSMVIHKISLENPR
jgi:pyruvate kinase